MINLKIEIAFKGLLKDHGKGKIARRIKK